MQTCSTSPTQSAIEFTAYNDGTNKYTVLEVLIDSSMNKYILHALEGDQVAPQIVKITPDGNTAWAKSYSGLLIIHEAKRMVLSGDQNTIRMISERSTSRSKFTQISTSMFVI